MDMTAVNRRMTNPFQQRMATGQGILTAAAAAAAADLWPLGHEKPPWDCIEQPRSERKRR